MLFSINLMTYLLKLNSFIISQLLDNKLYILLYLKLYFILICGRLISLHYFTFKKSELSIILNSFSSHSLFIPSTQCRKKTPDGERSGLLSLTCAFKSRLFVHRSEDHAGEENKRQRKGWERERAFSNKVRYTGPRVVGVGRESRGGTHIPYPWVPNV